MYSILPSELPVSSRKHWHTSAKCSVKGSDPSCRGLILYGPEPVAIHPYVMLLLLTVYALPFEIASVVLLVALIGAIVLAGKKGE